MSSQTQTQKPKRGRPRKEEEDASTFSENENNDVIETEVQEHDTDGDNSLLSLAGNLINNKGTKRPSKTQRYKANKKAREEDFSNMVIVVLTLGLSSLPVPDDLKPNEGEISAFSVPLTKILLRHFPITGKISADFLDIIGMMAAASGYYMRTSQAWRDYNTAKNEQEGQS